jgi:hypothetical protein
VRVFATVKYRGNFVLCRQRDDMSALAEKYGIGRNDKRANFSLCY